MPEGRERRAGNGGGSRLDVGGSRAALAVIAAANSRTYGARDAFNLRDDYTKITEMTREISDLSVFIVQEDFFNAIQPPMR